MVCLGVSTGSNVLSGTEPASGVLKFYNSCMLAKLAPIIIVSTLIELARLNLNIITFENTALVYNLICTPTPVVAATSAVNKMAQ